MNTTEIPTGEPISSQRLYTKDISLAAACMADDLIPRLTLNDIRVFIDGEDRLVQFIFPDNPDVLRVFGDWCKCDKNQVVNTPTGKIYRAFYYWNQLVNIIRDSKLNSRPLGTPEGFEWTTNTKIPATALAMLSGPVVSTERLWRMVYRNGRDCGFFVKTGEVTAAYENPEEYIRLNPDSHISYIVCSFYHRDHLRDIAKQVPAHHVFKEGRNYHVIPEPQPVTAKEIPCPKNK